MTPSGIDFAKIQNQKKIRRSRHLFDEWRGGIHQKLPVSYFYFSSRFSNRQVALS
jgi:hypothetical protein